MRRRQILAASEAPEVRQPVEIQPVRELRPPADDEPCPLCGRKKLGRPKR